MFIIKQKYYLYIENLEDIDFNAFKTNKKINIIYRNPKNDELSKIIKFINKCKIKKYKFYIANNSNLVKKTKADGLYISAHNKKNYYINTNKIGSAHNLKEINQKLNQNCKNIIFSRLFKTTYKNKKNYLGVIKFNLLRININKNIIPLGGINHQNLLKLNMVNCDSFALLSSLKKKPAISSRLF